VNALFAKTGLDRGPAEHANYDLNRVSSMQFERVRNRLWALGKVYVSAKRKVKQSAILLAQLARHFSI
jgi:hypothetical protein